MQTVSPFQRVNNQNNLAPWGVLQGTVGAGTLKALFVFRHEAQSGFRSHMSRNAIYFAVSYLLLMPKFGLLYLLEFLTLCSEILCVEA